MENQDPILPPRDLLPSQAQNDPLGSLARNLSSYDIDANGHRREPISRSGLPAGVVYGLGKIAEVGSILPASIFVAKLISNESLADPNTLSPALAAGVIGAIGAALKKSGRRSVTDQNKAFHDAVARRQESS